MTSLWTSMTIATLVVCSSAAHAWWGPWGGNNWGNNYQNGYGGGWGGLGGDQYRSGEASGGGDFSMNLSGRMKTNMRGYGNGYGVGDGWSRGYNYSTPRYGYGPYGYPAPIRPYPGSLDRSAMQPGVSPDRAASGYDAPSQSEAEPLAQPTDERAREVITDTAGMTLYTYDQDGPGVSNCYGQCAANWPPALLPDSAAPGEGLGVIERRDGTRQLALDGMPLYLWRGDQNPGDRTGDGIGGVWQIARR